jgi:hypothetical protein
MLIDKEHYEHIESEFKTQCLLLLHNLEASVDTNSTEQKQQYLFEKAEDVRKFEINLLWQRSLYFWGFLVVTFGGYAALKSTDNNADPLLNTAIACLGLVCAVAWTLSNRSSRFWFRVWEHKAKEAARDHFDNPVWIDRKQDKKGNVVTIESEFYNVSEILRDNIKQSDGFWVGRFSVVRLSTMISDFVVLLWLGILIRESDWLNLPPFSSAWITVPTLIYIAAYFFFGRGKDRD